MRSGSYVKAMGDMEDSDDSDGSPKPSPKSAARRQSYLRATQQSLSDQMPSRKYDGVTPQFDNTYNCMLKMPTEKKK